MPAYIADATWWGFVFQALVSIAPIVGSYIAYRWTRVSEHIRSVEISLQQIGYHQDEEAAKRIATRMKDKYNMQIYFWPLVLASLVILVLYSMTHPFIIKNGLWVGTLEEVVDIFGAAPPMAISAGRVLFWGWLGAYIYSFNLIFKRFMAYDLTPSVYVFAATRFMLAWIIGSIVAVGMGTALNKTTGMDSELNMTTIFVVVFFIGFFPEQGLDWINVFAKNRMRLLRRNGEIVKETRLSDIEGLSIWQQARLQQEGIENVQNLATADIPQLIMNTPFPVGQIIDWVDQAILLVYANGNNPKRYMYNLLEDAGVRCASDFLTVTETDELQRQLAEAINHLPNAEKGSKITPERLVTLRKAVQSAPNVRITCYYRWQFSMDEERVSRAEAYKPLMSASHESTYLLDGTAITHPERAVGD